MGNVCGRVPMCNGCGRNIKERAINQMLKADFENEKKIVKLLLFGTAESGKSTILRQMKIIHGDGYNDEERLKKREAVYNNVLLGTASIIYGMKTLRLHYDSPDVQNSANKIMREIGRPYECRDFNAQIVQAVKAVWEDNAVQKDLLPRRNEFQFTESYTYFMNEIERISQKEYVPNVQDILMLRITTTGITEVNFVIKKVNFRVFDVGGQRNERRKWFHLFDNIHAILFVVAISEFDQKIQEDGSTNRMVESMRLFQLVCNSKRFSNIAIVLFLNKVDLFKEKIKKTSINCVFKTYTGPHSYDAQIKYTVQKFKALCPNPNKTIYSHETCATDTIKVIVRSRRERN
uniref:Uncharacterized protein n=1 Tax=Globodera rostochiensis TaxID=31243 RepID=A0A914GWB5_GLORO